MTLEVTQHQTADGTEDIPGSSRRAVLRAAGVGGAVVAVGLTAAACGNSSSGNTSANSPASAAGGASSAPASAGSGGAGGTLLAQTSDIPLDGGKIVTTDNGTVVTQPSAGTYKAFTAICTHQGCTVGSVSNNQIMCPCHGSIYSAVDGHVIQGPAPAPLAAKTISVSAGQIMLTS